ncbi:hypothetical protein HETIRDRAFT_431289 [Heterobasidion irregulare TC 32-1]|uniref:Homeobox domain-containing protein n=1 Tax=Heterobasidion irregulare (strain TC 32-1) TaxID=747525 RepID=W4KNK4_HETIT|nr:uncharacterized protein HETIRDRAFT_431289 [Heterobasidion irregulare TC 32-1]ETW86636.1 hypothetical protein HETIRDRAFT_431289 [Heterobasidion irregulare TC 32-1]
MAPVRHDISRTSSIASMSSDDIPNIDVEGLCGSAKRTRKRFTNLQLMMLEQLFHRTSHPTRDEREALAAEVGMESKSVTIWFQNRRQTERRATLHNATSSANAARVPVPTSSVPFPIQTPSTTRRRVSSIPSSSSSYFAPETPFNRRPSLDHVASRSELRTAPPRTPSRRHDPSKSLWDNMPSSPLAPPSPPAREYVEFGKNKRTRTLEWACAAARLADKEKGRAKMSKVEDGDETEEEDPQEAITPMGSLTGIDPSWEKKKESQNQDATVNDDVMTAALVLCGLGRRPT